MKLKRLSVVVTSLANGGAEKVAVQLCNIFAKQGIIVQIIPIMITNNSLKIHPDIILSPPADIAVSNNFISRLYDNLKRISHIKKQVKNFNPDIILAHTDRTNILALIASMQLKIPIIVTEHNHPELHPIGKMWEILRKITYPFAVHIVGVSQGIIDDLPNRQKIKASAIHNPISVPNLDFKLEQNLQKFIAMGRLTHQKGFDILINSFAKIEKKFPNSSLAIIGEGEEREKLEQQIDRLGLNDKISLLGFLDDPFTKIIEYSIFIFPSRYEGFGLALCEAMAIGLPVISADCKSGPSEMIKNEKNGILVPPENSDALANAMERLLNDRKLTLKIANEAKKNKIDFSQDTIALKWLNLINKAMLFKKNKIE